MRVRQIPKLGPNIWYSHLYIQDQPSENDVQLRTCDNRAYPGTGVFWSTEGPQQRKKDSKAAGLTVAVKRPEAGMEATSSHRSRQAAIGTHI